MNEQPKSPEGNEVLNQLADQLEDISRKKFPAGDRMMSNLVMRLRTGDIAAVKIFCNNEADKFSAYREDAVPLIIETVFGGAGSPWSSVEARLKKQKATE
jgi:hypothetical protein